MLGPSISDPSALVRLRVAELMGSSRMQVNQPVLDNFAQDGDDLVRAMADAFRTRPKPANRE